jgi:hypothetical protein
MARVARNAQKEKLRADALIGVEARQALRMSSGRYRKRGTGQSRDAVGGSDTTSGANAHTSGGEQCYSVWGIRRCECMLAAEMEAEADLVCSSQRLLARDER